MVVVAEGDNVPAKELFINGAVLFGALDGKLEHGPIKQFYRNVDPVGGDKNFKARVDVLYVGEALAVVRVLGEGWGNRVDFTDILLLLKMGGERKCATKANNQNSNTVRKYIRRAVVYGIMGPLMFLYHSPKERQT